jgi:hypothetical protein
MPVRQVGPVLAAVRVTTFEAEDDAAAGHDSIAPRDSAVAVAVATLANLRG